MARKVPGRTGARVRCRQPVVAMVSLGCAKNTVDSERVLGMLAERGFVISVEPEDADVVLVNTCAFIAPAREETEKTLRELSRGKRRPPVVALGCYPERLSNGRARAPFRHSRLPGVEALVGFGSYDRLPELCVELAARVAYSAPFSRTTAPAAKAGSSPKSGAGHAPGSSCFDRAPRLPLGSPATAYLKIAEGCSNRCRYCTIPSIRGPLVSVPMGRLLREAEDLVRSGARELCVIAQDTASYGTDIYGRPRLPELLRDLCRIGGLRWIRVMYLHPAHITDEILDTIAGEERICRYLDLPLQHISTRILRAMGRRYTGADVRRLIGRVRARVPTAAIRTSMIVGLPGETADEFRELAEFVEETRFEHLGAFVYSREKGTPAARLRNQVSPLAASRRRGRLMRLQQKIAFERLDTRVSGVETVMLELPGGRPGEWIARTEREAPEVDGNVLVKLPAGARARPGEFLRVRMDSRSGYDLVATPSARSGPRSCADDAAGSACGRELR